MWACAVRVELHIVGAQSLKEKRAMLRPHLERLKKLASVSVAEVDNHDFWQRATVGMALVAPDRSHLDSVLERLRRYLDSQNDIEMIDLSVTYLEEP
jgi:uncharacterized protein